MINYYLITKPGIIFGNVLTLIAGFLLASKGDFPVLLFFATLLGLVFVVASACVLNNYIDREMDKKMKRTQDRVLVKKLITNKNALVFSFLLGILGFIVLYFVNLLTIALAFTGFFIYIVPYSLWKSQTVHATAIGSIAGAMPPVIGYCAVCNQLDLGAFILFGMMVLWQMPHFHSIAVCHIKDYAMAGIPVLPLHKGMMRTKVHMMLYIAAFIPAVMALSLLEYTGFVVLGVSAILGLCWLGLCAVGFQSHDDPLWGKYMFRWSLVTILAICLAIAWDSIN
jgi:protoheme IX farnesyltransferase